jgi:hypothetical protein
MAPHITPDARRVRVDGRADVGLVVDEGKNIGSIYCVAVYFSSTGEVIYYEKGRERAAEE